MAELLCGTSSWSEKSWREIIYPRSLKPVEWLSHYATLFPTVEADVSWYRIPTPQMVERWAESTEESFVMTAKFPRSVVHGGRGARPNASRVLVLEEIEEDATEFLEVMSLLGPRLGPLLLQFPHFGPRHFDGPYEFLDRLDRFLGWLPRERQVAVELRNPDWLGEPLFEVLRRHRAALALVEIRGMPPAWEVAKMPGFLSSDFLYARLIGDRAQVEALAERYDTVVVDQDASLAAWARLLRDLLPGVRQALLFANNHYAGHAPATIARLREFLAQPPQRKPGC